MELRIYSKANPPKNLPEAFPEYLEIANKPVSQDQQNYTTWTIENGHKLKTSGYLEVFWGVFGGYLEGIWGVKPIKNQQQNSQTLSVNFLQETPKRVLPRDSHYLLLGPNNPLKGPCRARGSRVERL